MLLSIRLVPFVGLALILSVLPVSAAEEDSEAAAEPPEAAVPTEVIAALIKQLDGDDRSEREAAGQRLVEAGKAAVPALVEAATSDNLQVSIRSIRILQRLLISPDEATKAAAKVGLDEVARRSRLSSVPGAKPAIPHRSGFGAIQRRRPSMPGSAKADPAKSIEDATKQLRRVGEQLDEALEDAEGTTELHKALKDFQEELKRQLVVVEKQLKK